MITVCLYGGLRKYGRRIKLHAETPAEALHAVFVQIRGLRQAVRDGVYQVRFGGEDQTADTVSDNFRRPASGILHIVPRVAGAGKNGGIIQTILGASLIVIGTVTSWTGGMALISAGIGMVAGGVAQMLAKPPNMSSGKEIDSSRNSSFSNLDNTAAQGNPVPVAYGLCYCGSRVVSQGVESRRVDSAKPADSASTVQTVVFGVARKKISAGGAVKSGSGKTIDESGMAAADLTLGMEKTFVSGVAAAAPNGQKYNTDFGDDSVRARNYTASYSVE